MYRDPYTTAHRFGLGAGPKDIQLITQNPQAWLKQQLRADTITDLEGDFASAADLLTDKSAAGGKPTKEQRREMQKRDRDIYTREVQARFHQAIASRTPLIERLVMFWSNHFTVSVLGKRRLQKLAGAFEREAIRPHVLGKFSDMLLAVTQHPAMLIYLDNVVSFGPNSKVGRKRKRGLNENLAREILELHTLGVNGGYTQDDVIGLAKIITGWTIVPPQKGGGGFKYIDSAHEPGAHVLLGESYPQAGQAQGIEALKDLAIHPSTARFISTKLARHFIADQPPQSAIAKLESVFLETQGDLRAMMESLIDMPEVWQTTLPKVKKPYELVISAFKLADMTAMKSPFKQLLKGLKLLEHRPFMAPSPAGWPDREADWLSPNAMMTRVEWCHAFAQMVKPTDNPHQLAKAVLGDIAKTQTLQWIERAPSAVDGLALLLASPEWQRR